MARQLHDNTHANPAAHLDDAELERLGDVDDVIFPALDGDATALARAPETLAQAGSTCNRQALRESRRQYLRYAESVWRQLRSQSACNPALVAAVLKVVALLDCVDW